MDLHPERRRYGYVGVRHDVAARRLGGLGRYLGDVGVAANGVDRQHCYADGLHVVDHDDRHDATQRCPYCAALWCIDPAW